MNNTLEVINKICDIVKSQCGSKFDAVYLKLHYNGEDYIIYPILLNYINKNSATMINDTFYTLNLIKDTLNQTFLKNNNNIYIEINNKYTCDNCLKGLAVHIINNKEEVALVAIGAVKGI